MLSKTHNMDFCNLDSTIKFVQLPSYSSIASPHLPEELQLKNSLVWFRFLQNYDILARLGLLKKNI